MDALSKVFLACAVIGGLLVVIRLLLQFIGGMGDHDASDAGGDAGDLGDLGHDLGGDAGGDAASAGHHADSSFTIFSLQNLSAFLLMFGLVGMALHIASGVGTAGSVLGGFLAGVIMVAVLIRLLTATRKLQSSGTLNFQNAVGEEGEVYLTIRPGGIGKVQAVVQGRMTVLNAKSDDAAPIETGARVRVEKIVSGNVLVVKRL